MSRRRDVRMRADEVETFLAGRAGTRAIVVALDAHGLPSGGVGGLLVEGTAVGVALAADDPVGDLLARDDRACCIVEHFPSYYGIQGVMLHGRARRTRATRPTEATFELIVERVVSYDFAKLLDA